MSHFLSQPLRYDTGEYPTALNSGTARTDIRFIAWFGNERQQTMDQNLSEYQGIVLLSGQLHSSQNLPVCGHLASGESLPLSGHPAIQKAPQTPHFWAFRNASKNGVFGKNRTQFLRSFFAKHEVLFSSAHPIQAEPPIFAAHLESRGNLGQAARLFIRQKSASGYQLNSGSTPSLACRIRCSGLQPSTEIATVFWPMPIAGV
jgi:hypothetical protein